MPYDTEDMQPEDQKEQDPQTEEEQVRAKLSAIKKARKHKEDVEKKYRWKTLIDEYKGKFEMAEGRMDIGILPINLVYAYVKTEIPALYIRDPELKVNPKNRTSVQAAKVLEAVINYIWRTKKIKREIKKVLVDSIIIGHGWMKLGYTGKFGSVEDVTGRYIDTVEEEDFFAYYVNWENINFNLDSIDPPYDCKWISHAVWLTKEEIEKNPRYQNTDLLQISFEDRDDDDHVSTDREFKKGKVRLEEVWDLENQTVCTVSDGVDKYIEAPKQWPLQMKGFPFACLKFNLTNDEPYGLSDVAMFEPQVLELIKVRSMALDHIKRYNRQLVTTPDNISEDEMQKLQKGITGSIIHVQDPSKIMPVPYPPLQTDIYGLEERIKEDAINVSGQSPMERGGSQKTTTRAVSELGMIQQGAANRRSEKVDTVETFVEEVAGKLVSLVKQFVDMPYYVRILGHNSPELQAAVQERASAMQDSAVTNQEGFTFTGEDIEGEFDLEVVAGTSTPLDKAEKLKSILQLIELAPKAGAIPGGPFIGTLAKVFVEEMNMPELIMALEAEQQMKQQQQAQQQQQAEELRQLALADKASQTQIEAENAATRQQKVSVEAIKAVLNARAKGRDK